MVEPSFKLMFPFGERHGALVSVVMGSDTDWPECMKFACDTLEELQVPFETGVVSAHRTHGRLIEYAGSAESRGIRVIVAGAGGAAHLPGMIASQTLLPVHGVPVQSKALNGMDSLLSIVQMPPGVPTATFSIGRSGAINAALQAVRVLALEASDIRDRLVAYIRKQAAAVPLVPYKTQ